MKTTDSIATIYNILVEIEGPILARETVTSILYSAIAEIQTDGQAVTPEILDKKLEKEATFFIKASKKVVA